MNSLAVVIGAATPPGRLHRAAHLAVAHAQAAGAHVGLVDLSEVALPMAGTANDDDLVQATAQALDTIQSARAVLIASPVYRATYPGVLKNLLDLLPVAALTSKPVGVLAMGGSHHHYLAVDRDLRSTLSWFGALVAPTGVYLTGKDFDADGAVSTAADDEISALTATLLQLADRLAGLELGPPPLAARAW